jgi:hypothetical protein
MKHPVLTTLTIGSFVSMIAGAYLYNADMAGLSLFVLSGCGFAWLVLTLDERM